MIHLYPMEDNRFYLSWYVTKKEAGLYLKQFLTNKAISKRALTDIKFKGGQLLVNGQPETVRYQLQADDEVKVIFPHEPINEGLQAENIPLHIVYEDAHLLIIHKKSGMNTIPSREHPNGSLANALVHYYEKNKIYSSIHIVTRLDRETSGLVLIAKHRYAHHLCSEMQKKFLIERRYEAFVTGRWGQGNGVINQPIGRKIDSIIEREVSEDGQVAITHYELLKQYKKFAHIRLRLETGRTHQIRVHMSFLGHPLLGDELYGGDKQFISRFALHCCELAFIHPITGEALFLTSELPKDMINLMHEK